MNLINNTFKDLNVLNLLKKRQEKEIPKIKTNSSIENGHNICTDSSQVALRKDAQHCSLKEK